MDNRSQILNWVLAASGNPTGVRVIAIDGPTASGKTILCDWLSSQLAASGIPCWTYRVDWSLCARTERSEDLAGLRGQECDFPFEGELHMRLDRVREFL